MELENEGLFQNRIYAFDILKGIAITLVLWGHLIQITTLESSSFYESFIIRFIYSFHMPLFMMISGYLFYGSLQRHSLKNNIKNKFKQLLLPILMWGSINYVMRLLIEKDSSIVDLIVQVKAYWFLWALLLSVIIVSIVAWFRLPIKFETICFIAAGVLIYIALTYLTSYGWIAFFCPDVELMFFVYPFFVLGYVFKRWISERPNVPAIIKSNIVRMIIPTGVVFLIFLSYFHTNSYIYVSGLNPILSDQGVFKQISIDVFRFVLGVTGSLFMIETVLLLQNIKYAFKDGVRKCFIFLGIHSLEIYLIQRTLIELLLKYIYRTFLLEKIEHYNIVMYNIAIIVFVFIFEILVCSLIRTLKRNRLLDRVLFGLR